MTAVVHPARGVPAVSPAAVVRRAAAVCRASDRPAPTSGAVAATRTTAALARGVRTPATREEIA